MAKRKHKRGSRPPSTLKVYKAYFFRGADPAIAEIRQLAGTVSGKQIEKDGGPAATTVANWFSGKTRRPQNATLEAAGRALGMKRMWVPVDKPEEDED